MVSALPSGFYWDPSLQLGSETSELTVQNWPNYLILESDIPEPGLTAEIQPAELARRFPVWGIRQSATNKLVAFANAAQVFVDPAQALLPDAGWTFAIESAFSARTPNCLCLLVANIDASARELGLSQILINRAKLATQELGFKTMIAPVRPTLKHELPLLPMNEYLHKKSKTGDHYDPWLRLHVKCGAQIANICPNSVRVRASLRKWREWTGLALDKAGEHLLPQGLAPLQLDLEHNIGVYTEPNVWVRYPL